MTAGGFKGTSDGGEDDFDDEGYDESQRAEILEVTRDGPTDGTILTDLEPDVASVSDDDEDEDELDMEDGEVGKADAEADPDEDDLDEDDLQDDLDEDDVDDETLSDADDHALKP